MFRAPRDADDYTSGCSANVPGRSPPQSRQSIFDQ
jgi:hypothetical protein